MVINILQQNKLIDFPREIIIQNSGRIRKMRDAAGRGLENQLWQRSN